MHWSRPRAGACTGRLGRWAWASAGAGPGPGEVMRPSEGCGGQSVGGEVLVVASSVLAGPLVELLAGAAAGAIDVQAQAAAGILELPGTVGLLHRQPLAAGRPVHRLLHDVRRPGCGGIARYGEVVAGVLRLQPVGTDRHVVVSAGESAAAGLGRCHVDGERVV